MVNEYTQHEEQPQQRPWVDTLMSIVFVLFVIGIVGFFIAYPPEYWDRVRLHGLEAEVSAAYKDRLETAGIRKIYVRRHGRLTGGGGLIVTGPDGCSFRPDSSVWFDVWVYVHPDRLKIYVRTEHISPQAIPGMINRYIELAFAGPGQKRLDTEAWSALRKEGV